MPRDYRTGSITLEEAKEQFHKYYDKRGNSNIGRLRAKLNDMKYQKKSKFTLKPGAKGSIKYMLEEGPRTFDMEGVDWFPEGTEFEFNTIGYDKPVKGISLGATKDKTDDEAYGPKVKRKDGKEVLYKKYFKKQYKEWKEKSEKKSGDKKNIVDIYWEKYKKNPNQLKRKNKKKLTASELKKKISEIKEMKKVVEAVKFEYDGHSYYITSDLLIFNTENDKPELIGSLSDIDEELRKHLISKGYVLMIGNKYLLMDEDSSKYYYFKIIDDDKKYKINSLREVYDSNNNLVATSLESFLNFNDIENFELELLNNETDKKLPNINIKKNNESSSESDSESDNEDQDITKLMKDIKMIKSPKKTLTKQDKDNIISKLSSKGYKKLRGSPIKNIVEKLK